MNIFSTLFLIFITLKLANLVDWSYWIVFAPVYIPVFFILLVSTFLSKEDINDIKLKARKNIDSRIKK